LAVAIIILAVLSVFAVGIAMIVFMPVMHDLAFEQAIWDTAPQDAKIVRNTIYNAALAMPIFMIGAIILWAYLSVTRRDTSEF